MSVEQEDWEEYEDDEEWEYEEDEDWWSDEDDDFAPPELSRTLRLGFVAMAPLFLMYEWASAPDAGAPMRSVSELVLTAPLMPLGDERALAARRLLLTVLFVVALAIVARQSVREERPIVPRIGRVLVEGALGALALGPLLALAARYAEPWVGALDVAHAQNLPDMRHAALAMGGAAYEEIVFRIGILALGYVGVRQLFRVFGSSERFAAVAGAIGGGVLSATSFAASHVAAATSWLGPGGEAFSSSAFAWRTAAGLLLAGLVCWRGVGVAAWAHAFYNLGRMLGIGDAT